jgi:hypothetical protein
LQERNQQESWSIEKLEWAGQANTKAGWC